MSTRTVAKQGELNHIDELNSIASIEVRFQRFKKEGKITKILSMDKNSKLKKDSSNCGISNGFVKTQTTSINKLAHILNEIRDKEYAIALSNKDYRHGYNIVTKGNETKGAISRSINYFNFVSGPSFLLFDIDFCMEYPVKPYEGVFDDIISFFPEFKDAAKVVSPSTSSNISTSSGEVLTGDNGFHIYCVVEDALVLNDVKTIRNNLLVRAWNAGKGFIHISKSGSELKRCPIDLSVISPERLIFESNPELKNGLIKKSKPAFYIDGGYLL